MQSPENEAPRAQPLDSKNLIRKIYHAAGGLIAPVLYLFVASRAVVLVISLVTMALVFAFEFLRLRMPAFNDFVMRRVPVGLKSDERHRVAAHAYIVVAFFLVILCAHRAVAIAAMTFLACGDPAGAVVGMAWGRHKIGQGPKSWEGTAACFVASLAVGGALAACVGGSTGAALPLWAVAAGAATATVTELYHGRLDDNFVIPVASAAVMEALLRLSS